MIGFDDAIARLRDSARALEQTDVALTRAAGHILADDIVACLDSPRQDNSAMDGYAICSRDLPGPFTVIGQSTAGAAPVGPPLQAGEAMRIFTGAPMPPGGDRVIVQEICERAGNTLRIKGDAGGDMYTRPAASDFAQGDMVLRRGALLGPGQLVLAAAADRDTLPVWRRARVALLATGDELVLPGTATGQTGRIPESITPGVAALVQLWGGTITAVRHAADDPSAIETEAEAMLDAADILVVIGGASVGSRDFASHAAAHGKFHTVFSKVAMQPGKPVWCASDGAGRYVLGLPGNPVSAMVTARLFLAPLLYALAARDFMRPLGWTGLELTGTAIIARPREQFVRGIRDGHCVTPIDNQLSSAQRALAIADTLIRVPAGTARYRTGTILDCLEF